MMSSAFKYDVIVVGGGPGGSAAAKRCAEHGLKVLLLEKYKLPRHKVCAGWLIGSFTQNAVVRGFGSVPQNVLNDPPNLSGFMIHTPGGKRERVEGKIPQAWRKDLDYWTNQKAADAGAEIWDNVRATGFAEDNRGCSVRLVRKGREQEINTRYVIGCDGARSIVRRFLYPDLRSHTMQALEHWYRGSLGDLEREYLHEFLYPDAHYDTRSVARGAICGVAYKEDFFYIGAGARPGRGKENMQMARDLLARFYGFDLSRQPLWIDSCVVPELHVNLIDGSLRPARGNILLVGDAAGLLDLIEGGGIGLAVHSGVLAADSILRAAQKGDKAENHYLEAMKGVISAIAKMHSYYVEAKKQIEQGVDDVLLMQNAVRYLSSSIE